MTLEIEDLGVELRTPKGTRWLFRHLELTITPGSVIAVVGPNGAGKSTLLRTLLGLHAPAEGGVRWNGRPLANHDARTRAQAIAYLPQSTPLHYDLPVEDVVMLGRMPYLHRFRPIRAHDRDAVAQALAQVGADDLRTRRIASLSGGERQRVMLARMLATGAPLLLLDEPTTGLDVGHALGFMELLATLAAHGRMVIAALHDLELARRYADQAVLLRGEPSGRIDAGPVANTLVADVLGPVFEVEVVDSARGLWFFPRGHRPPEKPA